MRPRRLTSADVVARAERAFPGCAVEVTSRDGEVVIYTGWHEERDEDGDTCEPVRYMPPEWLS